MRLVTFKRNGEKARVGALAGRDTVIDLRAASEASLPQASASLASMQSLIESGEAGLDNARRLADSAPEEACIALEECHLLAPLPRPSQIRDFLAFEQHFKQAFDAALQMRAKSKPDPESALAELREKGGWAIPPVWYRQPIYYKANRFAISGPDDDVIWPAYSRVMDYELELAAVIGQKGVDIPEDKAAGHIFGYTIFNDFSARDAQSAEMAGRLGPAKGKDFDGANAFGPCIVTRDEIANPYALQMLARVNGEEWSRNNSSTMDWRFEQCIAHVSRGETLYPGEILGSGTVGGGCGLEQLRFLQHGDVVELEVEGIGVLRNRVLSSVKAVP
jgi:2-keto-4-pentenoate hydratase/2-oxohepta-3-ene-1,7-dioic acid hydratase in catechol pathway